MSAILLGKNPLESLFDSEEGESKQKNSIKDDKEQIIKGKNKTYVISKTLGKGTFGKVKLAYNQENKNEKYACKILLKSNIKDEDDNLRSEKRVDGQQQAHILRPHILFVTVHHRRAFRVLPVSRGA